MSYSTKVLDHFKNPRNQGVIENANAVGEEGNPVCGDVMKIYLDIQKRIDKEGREEEYIKDIKFETLGCAAAIAVSSDLTEMAKGLSLEAALELSKDDVVSDLGGLPEPKIHCSMLGVDALRQAIRNYQRADNKQQVALS